jgi:hypothetical protein
MAGDSQLKEDKMLKTRRPSELDLEVAILRNKIEKRGDPMPRETVLRASAEKELLAREERAAYQDHLMRKQGWKVRPFEAVMKEKFGTEIRQFQRDQNHQKTLDRLRKGCKSERAFECARVLFSLS